MSHECSIKGCGKKHYGHGWCLAHYKRWRRHGDPLKGRTPNGTLPEWLSSHLNYSGEECLIWPFTRDGHGYAQINVNGKRRPAHREMLCLMNGEPPTSSHQAAHSCGNGHLGCIHPKHLRWATRKENIADSIEHGTIARGERNGHAKLTRFDVLAIRSADGLHREIGNQFGVTNSMVSMIKSRKKWAWL